MNVDNDKTHNKSTLLIKSLLTSLCQREAISPWLVMRGKGRFYSQYEYNQSLKKSVVRNEKGVALVMVLILAVVSLLIMAGLLYMITSSTQISGMQKKYKTSLDAGFGGAEIAYQFIGLRGDSALTSSFQNLLNSITPPINPVINTPNSCTGTDDSGTSYTGLAAKLMTPTYIEDPPGSGNLVLNWSSACNRTVSIDPGTATSYDMTFELGTGPTYIVYAKIVDTVEGNSPIDQGLGGEGVVVAGTGVVTVMKMPYLYTMEMDAQDATNPFERAKLSILYQY